MNTFDFPMSTLDLYMANAPKMPDSFQYKPKTPKPKPIVLTTLYPAATLFKDGLVDEIQWWIDEYEAHEDLLSWLKRENRFYLNMTDVDKMQLKDIETKVKEAIKVKNIALQQWHYEMTIGREAAWRIYWATNILAEIRQRLADQTEVKNENS